MKVQAYGFSSIGKREYNQDSFLILDERKLFAVADGVGGGVKGDVASQMAVQCLEKQVRSPLDLKLVFENAQEEILKEAMSTVGSPSMGTTLTAAMFSNDQLYVCHVGDSRLYRITDGCCQQLTEDQEFYEESVQSTVLANYLGIPEELYPLKVIEKVLPVSFGSRYILCSDGLYRQMSETEIAELIEGNLDAPDQIPKLLAEQAAQYEYSDNVTVVFIQVG